MLAGALSGLKAFTFLAFVGGGVLLESGIARPRQNKGLKCKRWCWNLPSVVSLTFWAGRRCLGEC